MEKDAWQQGRFQSQEEETVWIWKEWTDNSILDCAVPGWNIFSNIKKRALQKAGWEPVNMTLSKYG